jgi:hypothetical protein
MKLISKPILATLFVDFRQSAYRKLQFTTSVAAKQHSRYTNPKEGSDAHKKLLKNTVPLN